MKTLFSLSLIVILSSCGSAPPEEHTYSTVLPELPSDLTKLEKYIAEREDSLPIRKNNQARIIWQDSSLNKTEYAIVYLHGFGASWRDAYPLNTQVADSLNANIYMARWGDHGLKPPHSMQGFTAESAWQDAKQALVIGNSIGEKTIVMSTSTGGTLALMLAMYFPDHIFSLINISPNVEDDVEGASMLDTKVGPAIAKIVSMGDYRKVEHKTEAAKQYFDTLYPAQALVHLQTLVGSRMMEEYWSKINVPMLTLYYHKNFMQEDERVEVDDFPNLHQAISTPDSLHRLIALSTPGTHFIGSEIKSEDYSTARDTILDFLQYLIPEKI